MPKKKIKVKKKKVKEKKVVGDNREEIETSNPKIDVVENKPDKQVDSDTINKPKEINVDNSTENKEKERQEQLDTSKLLKKKNNRYR